jgi:hypothetical protein
MTAIIDAQGRCEDWLRFALSLKKSSAAGYVTGIDNLLLARGPARRRPDAEGGVDLFRSSATACARASCSTASLRVSGRPRLRAALTGRSTGHAVGRRAEVPRAFVEF